MIAIKDNYFKGYLAIKDNYFKGYLFLAWF